MAASSQPSVPGGWWLLAVALVILLVGNAPAADLEQGEIVPDLSLTSVYGGVKSITGYESERVIVYVWSVIGEKMKQDIVRLQGIATASDPEKLRVITVLAFSEDREPALAFCRSASVGLEMLVNDGSLEAKWGVGSQVPATFVLDSEDRLVSVHYGTLTDEVVASLAGEGFASLRAEPQTPDRAPPDEEQEEKKPAKGYLDGTYDMATRGSRQWHQGVMTVEQQGSEVTMKIEYDGGPSGIWHGRLRGKTLWARGMYMEGPIYGYEINATVNDNLSIIGTFTDTAGGSNTFKATRRTDESAE